MNEDERRAKLKEQETDVMTTLENWTDLQRAIAYKTLYFMDYRVSGINARIDRELRKLNA